MTIGVYMSLDNFSRLWHLVIEAPETWDIIAHEESKPNNLRSRYMWSLVTICAIVGFTVSWLRFDLQHAMAIALRDSVVLVAGYFAACWLCRWVIERLFPDRFNLEDSDKTVTYCYAYIIILQTFITIIPHSYFLYLLDVFVAYLLWEAARAVFALEEDERQSMVVYFTLIIVVVPIILHALITLVVLKNIF